MMHSKDTTSLTDSTCAKIHILNLVMIKSKTNSTWQASYKINGW